MMKANISLHILLAILLASLFSSCYHEVDLSDYRDEDGKNLLTINSMVCSDSLVAVTATQTYFFSDTHNERSYVKGLDISLLVNNQVKETLAYDLSRNLYVSTTKVNEGDTVKIITSFNNKDISATDIVPLKAELSDITVERRGPLAIYSNYDFVFTYRLTFTDNPNEENYYFLQWDEVARSKDVAMGERDFTHELVFQRLADQIHGTLPGWTPYSPYGLPFSDRGINGEMHTLILEEIIQAGYGTGNYVWKQSQMKRNFKLYSISKPYYDYLVSVLVNQTNDKGIQGGMIDLGIADPVKVYSNISGGVGIMGCYTISETEIDVIKIIGPFPEK